VISLFHFLKDKRVDMLFWPGVGKIVLVWYNTGLSEENEERERRGGVGGRFWKIDNRVSNQVGKGLAFSSALTVTRIE
jgi:hypothetical protein